MTSCAGNAGDDPRPERTRRGQRWTDQPLTAEQQALAADWVRHARAKARYWARHDPGLYGEFLSAAMYAVCEAARNFDVSMNLCFYTYLKWHFRHARKEVFRSATPMGYRITGSLRNCPKALARIRPTLLGLEPERDLATTDRDVAGERDQHVRDRLRVAAILEPLRPHHRAVVERVILRGETLEQVGRSLGQPKDQVVRLLTNGLRALGLRKLPGGRLVPLED